MEAETAKVFHYYVVFKAQHPHSIGDHSRCVSISRPIKFGTDIEAVANTLAKDVNATSAMILSWIEIDGIERPENTAPIITIR